MAISFDFVDELFGMVDPLGPGCAVGVYIDGESACTRGFGLANLEHRVPIGPSTVFHVASISKQFLAMLVGMLAAEGKLDLDQPLAAFLPELRVGGDATPRQLIHHTSGLRDQWGLLDLAGWRHEDLKTTADIVTLAARQRTLNFAPGSRFQYINTGYTLLGAIAERLTGTSARELARQRIFAPLGMHRTHFHDDFHEIIPDRADAYGRDDRGVLRIDVPAYATVGPTGLFSTVEDFAAWERNFQAPTICDRAAIAAMHRPGVLADGQSTGYGHGLALGSYRGLNTAEHAGGDAAFRSHYLRFPDRRFAVAIFCNTPAFPPGQFARYIADRVLARQFPDSAPAGPVFAAHRSRAAGVITPPSDGPTAWCGTYAEPGSHDRAKLEYRDGQFFLSSPDGTEYELGPLAEAEFAFAGLDATCRFGADPGGRRWMRTFYGGTETATLREIEDETASTVPIPPAEYLGTYFSEELDIAYTVAAADAVPVLSRGKQGTHPLAPIGPDRFSCAGGLVVRFCRDAANRVTAMTVSTERVWNVRFLRRARPDALAN